MVNGCSYFIDPARSGIRFGQKNGFPALYKQNTVIIIPKQSK